MGNVISAGHLGCSRCRIRVPASAPAIDLLESRCPICEAPLVQTPAANVIGFRLFDLDPFSAPAVPEPAAPGEINYLAPDLLGAGYRATNRPPGLS